MSDIVIAMKRSWGLYALPLFLALEAVSLSSRDQIWALEWQWATSWTNAILVLLGPATAGIAAAEAAHARRHGGGFVVRSFARGQLQSHLLRVGATATWSGIAHSTGFAGAWLITAIRHGELGVLEWRLVAPSFLFLLAAACVGACLGWLTRSLVTAPVVALSLYFLPAAQLLDANLLLLGGSTGPTSGTVYRPDMLLAQAGFWVAVAVAAWLLCARRSWLSTASGAAALGVALWAGQLVHVLGPDTVRSEPVVDVACAGTAPAVCVPADYKPILADVEGAARPVLSALAVNLGALDVERAVAFADPGVPQGAAVIPTWLEAPYTDEYNVAIGVLVAASGCDGKDPDPMPDVARIVPGAAPNLRGMAERTGVPLLEPDEARAAFEALRAKCVS